MSDIMKPVFSVLGICQTLVASSRYVGCGFVAKKLMMVVLIIALSIKWHGNILFLFDHLGYKINNLGAGKLKLNSVIKQRSCNSMLFSKGYRWPSTLSRIPMAFSAVLCEEQLSFFTPSSTPHSSLSFMNSLSSELLAVSGMHSVFPYLLTIYGW